MRATRTFIRPSVRRRLCRGKGQTRSLESGIDAEQVRPGSTRETAQRVLSAHGLQLTCCVSGPDRKSSYFGLVKDVGRLFFTVYSIAASVNISHDKNIPIGGSLCECERARNQGRASVIDRAWAHEFAKEWIAAWNSHDLERILSHYVEDFEMSSPLIIERNIDPSGVLWGKAAIREYWAVGLAAVPPIQFELIDVHVGVNSIGILYRSIGRRRVIEMLTFNDQKEVIRGGGLYGGPA
jgi:SnoaL-like domain